MNSRDSCCNSELAPARELQRKLIHLSATLVPVSYFFISRSILLFIILSGLVVALVVEYLRTRREAFQIQFQRLVGNLLRPSEKMGITGATYLILGCLFAVILFPKTIAIFAMGTATIADAAAAIVGKNCGRHRLVGGKSLEGSAVFFLATLGWGIVVGWAAFPALVWIALALTIAEILIPKADNLWIPLLAGVATWVFL